eukprot:Gb_34460 [translate_table: standard]
MKNSRPQALELTRGWRYIEVGALGPREYKSNEVGLSWNRLISPNIQGRMKETQNSMMSRGRTGDRFGLSTTLLSGGGSSPLRPRGSRLPLGEGSGLAMSLRSQRKGKGPTGLH